MNADRPLSESAILALLACPVTGSPLRRDGDELVSARDGIRYPIRDGIPVLHREVATGVEDLDGKDRRFEAG